MKKEKIRLQVEISKQAQEEIEKLKEKLNVNSYSEVIRSSLKLAKYLELEKEAGNEIIIRDKKTGKEKQIVFIG